MNITIKLHYTRIVVILAALVGMLSVFMPWVSVPMIGTLTPSSISKLTGEAGSGIESQLWWIALVAFILMAICAVIFGDKNKVLPAAYKYSTLGVSAVMLGYTIYGMVRFQSNLSQMKNNKDDIFGLGKMVANSISIQFGIILFIIALVVITIVNALPAKLLNKVSGDEITVDNVNAKPINRKKVIKTLVIIVGVLIVGAGGFVGVRTFQRYEAQQAAKAKLAKATKYANTANIGKVFEKLSKKDKNKVVYTAMMNYGKVIRNDVFEDDSYAEMMYDEYLGYNDDMQTTGHTFETSDITGFSALLDNYTDTAFTKDEMPKDVKALIKTKTVGIKDKLDTAIKKAYINEHGK